MPDHLNYSDKDVEMLTVLVKPPHQRNFLISLVYIPPSADKTRAIGVIESLDFSDKRYRKAVRIIAGDFNMDAAGSSKRQRENALIKSVEGKLHLSQLIKKPTRITTTNSSLIDLLFLSIPDLNNVLKSESIDYNISDHNMICLIYKKEHSVKQNISFTFRATKQYNRAILLHRLEKYDWTEFYEARDPEDAWGHLYTAYITVLNEIAPFQPKDNVPYRDEFNL